MFEPNLQITSIDAIPSIGSLLGSRGNTELLNSINKTLGNSNFFGSNTDRYSQVHNSFITKFIEPIRMANNKLFDISSRLIAQNVYRPLLCEEDLKQCPPCMIEPILTHEPMYKLLRQGRIDGYGIKYESLVDSKEMWDRLIETNGTIWYGIQEPNDDNEYHDEDTFEYGIDPYITAEDREYIEMTRDYVDHILKTTELDPSAPGFLRG